MSNSMSNPNALAYWDALSPSMKLNTKRFIYLEDTTGTRNAAYIGIVYTDPSNNTVMGQVGYGYIGRNLTFKDLYTGSYSSENAERNHVDLALIKVLEQVKTKTKKNYKMLENYQPSGSKAPNAVSLPDYLPNTINIYDLDFPELIEWSTDDRPHADLIIDNNIVFERIPNRMRMTYIMLIQQGIGIYNISGGLTGAIEYDGVLHNTFADFQEVIKDGVIFTGHINRNNKIVIQRFLRHLNTSNPVKNTWAQQKTITTLIMNTLYNDKEDIYDKNLPIYCADYVVDEDEKMAMIDDRGHGYATNVAFYNPHEKIEAINFLER